ncbi:MAG: transcription termination factor NusA [Candidatus Dormibacteria bacterium]
MTGAGDFMDALMALNQERGMDPVELQALVENALAGAYQRAFHVPGMVRVSVSPSGGLEVSTTALVADPVTDPSQQLSLETAQREHPDVRPGDVVEVHLPTEDFARLAAQTAKHAVQSRLRDAERDTVLRDVEEHRGEIRDGIVERSDPSGVVLSLGRLEGVLAPAEQIPGEDYRLGSHVKVLLLDPNRRSRQPQVQVSRAHRDFVKRLLEMEIPELAQGKVVIRGIAREPGLRTKVAVFTEQAGLDPVGACVGPKGVRIRAVVSELGQERVDVVPWSEEPEAYVASALSPATVTEVLLDRDTRTAVAVVPSDQLSLAIGRDGQNARLAARLTGWRIDIKPAEAGAEETASGPSGDTR